MSRAAAGAEADFIAGRGTRDLAGASPRYQQACTGRRLELDAISADMTHCPPCSASWQAWLDWTLPPAPIVLCSPNRTVREIAASQEARYQEWRTTVRTQQDLIHRICAARHQGRRQ